MPNGWEWAILVLIAVLLIGGARLSGISRDVVTSNPELEEAPTESAEPKSPSSPASAVPATPSPASAAEPSAPVDDEPAPSTETD